MNVLFVCVQNAGRSQIAEALFRRKPHGTHEARSAGSEPAPRVHENVAALMPELADRIPRRLARGDVEWADVVVTMGCGDACPYIPGKRYVEWELVDPAGKSVEDTRPIRDEIENRVDALIASLD